MNDWETVIGLEIHCRLATASKLFCGTANRYGAEPNVHTTTVDLGLPGALPVINRLAVEMALRFGIAIGAELAATCQFARKNYFYPDLPKGYQISQFDAPVVGPGRITITLDDGSEKCVRITRAHLEEDAGKSDHERFAHGSGIDLNRAGTPLIEIVSEPDMRTAREAVLYMKNVHALVRYLGICDGNMQEGSFRCDANVSVRHSGDNDLGTRTEIKNINSFRFVEHAIHYESQRQIEILTRHGTIDQETRLYDPVKNETRSMRDKEDCYDYRYFPEPDLPPVHIDADWVARLRSTLPELPDAKRQRFTTQYGLKSRDSVALAATQETADYFEACVAAGAEAQLAANWITGHLTATLRRSASSIRDCPVPPSQLAELLQCLSAQTLNHKAAKQVFSALWAGEGEVKAIIEAHALRQVCDTQELSQWIDTALDQHPQQRGQYRDATPEKRKKLFGFLIGQVMRISSGKANPQAVNRILRDRLE